MTKRSGPSTHLVLPELVDCDNCKGKGVIRGMFHEMVCDRCDGSGVVALNGESIDRETLVVSMKKAITKLRAQNKQLRIENQQYREKLGIKAIGHFDDFKTVCGGRYRGD